MTDATIGALIGVGGAIVGVIIAGPVTYYFSRLLINESHKKSIEIIKISDFISASAKLRAAFAPAKVKISGRRELGNTRLREFFNEAFNLHATAIEEFRPFASDADAYQKAYDEYRKALFEDDELADANHRWSSNTVKSDDVKGYNDFIAHISLKIEHILLFSNLNK